MGERLEKTILKGCAAAPSEPCMWWRGTWWSRSALEEMAAECAQNLIKSGFASGQRLGLVMPNSPLMLAACLAVWQLGGVIAPINPHLKHSFLPEYLKSIGIFGAIVNKEMGNIAERLIESGIPAAVAFPGDAIPPFDGGELTVSSEPETAALFHTSGAGGKAKAVPVSHSNIVTLLDALVEAIPSIDEDDIILNAIPNYNSIGFVVGAILPLVAGIPQTLIQSFTSPQKTLSAIREAGVTVIPAVPVMLSILTGGEKKITPPSKVKLVFYGGGTLLPGTAERVKEVFGVTPLPGYGLTEASSVLAVTPSEQALKEGTSGKILPCFEAKVIASSGELAPFNEEGRLWIKGGAVASGYFGTPKLSSERFKDEWFDTQDIVKIDEDGYITIVSPAVDVITTEGMSVYPGEIESVLKLHPDIEEAAVIGVSRGRKGEYPRAFVTVKEGSELKPKDIIAYGRANLPNYKAPRSVKIVGELPTDSLGKVLKNELRNM